MNSIDNLRFKVWDDENKKLSFVGAIDWEVNNNPPISCNTVDNKLYRYPPDELKLFQSTGLYDKNGVEGFYDCDVWRVRNCIEYSYIYQRPRVYLSDAIFILHQGSLRCGYTILSPHHPLNKLPFGVIFNKESDLEIIGNIFEDLKLKELYDNRTNMKIKKKW